MSNHLPNSRQQSRSRTSGNATRKSGGPIRSWGGKQNKTGSHDVCQTTNGSFSQVLALLAGGPERIMSVNVVEMRVLDVNGERLNMLLRSDLMVGDPGARLGNNRVHFLSPQFVHNRTQDIMISLSFCIADPPQPRGGSLVDGPIFFINFWQSAN
ncbi:hypothetical protein BDK51DRAFT_25521 [Blyttiomyces helicus]|uniref:Uncharacterized protein n=1 Tax=Blyttiomyces helicus TaxID=388810 RepID=A0A4P9W4D9_9FUNG|nr:hypothetical protein BDK51DRAFT_25521 [Blyttiomyces helicus]|eukprot:RKO85036.1 hypothetical protein BDK51DRAFT_25521 [Blyttiomyces helicus]